MTYNTRRLRLSRPTLQRNRKQYVLGRPHLDNFCVGQHVVTRADLAPELRCPILDVPLQPLGADDAGLPDGDDAHVLLEHVPRLVLRPRPLPHVDVVRPSLEEERQALAANKVDAALGVRRRLLEEVQVVQLRQALVHSAA